MTAHKLQSKLDVERLLGSVLQAIKPDKTVLKKVDKTLSIINESLRENNLDAVCIKGGSIAKDTFLKDDHDADLFVRFNTGYKDTDISSLLEHAINKKFSLERIHGSRDYFQFADSNINYELIPVLAFHNVADAVNVTDLSPEHVHWVVRYTSKDLALTDQIRLVKQFCKSAKIYGAESYINGFSGHIIDIIVIHFGSFIDTIKFFSNLHNVTRSRPVIIDHEHLLKNPIKELNESKLSPLIVIDPVQPGRNAAAALNEECLEIFINKCRSFLQYPDRSYFVIERPSLANSIKSASVLLRKLGKKFFVISLDIRTLDGSKDVVGTKVLKVHQELIKHSRSYEFVLLKSDWHFDFDKKSAWSYYIFEDINLSPTIEHRGPALNDKMDYDRFVQAHKLHKTYIKNDRIYATIPRKYCDVEGLFKDLLSSSYVASRIKSIKIIRKH